MRQIQNAAELEQKERKKRRIASIVIITLLLLSTAGFALSGVGIKKRQDDSPQQNLVFNGQYWTYSTPGGQQHAFTYNSNELDFSSVDISKTLADFSGKQVYLASNESVGLQEIAVNLRNYAGRLSEACYGPCEKDLPEKECAAGAEPLIIVRPSETLSVAEEENCIFINGDLRAVDMFLYRVLGLA